MQLTKRKLVSAIAVFCAALLVTGCVGIRNALVDPVERKALITLDRLPGQSPPVRIALLSDIHVGNFVMAPDRLNQVIDAVNLARPDIVLLAGDFVVGESKAGTAQRALDLAPLARLRAREGVFAVMGNHDHWTDPEAIRLNLRKAGVRILDNDAVRLGAITLVGVDDRFSGHDDIARSVERARKLGGIPVAFSHSPDLSPNLPRNFPILLAGHTHCGQLVLPWLGPVVRYSRGRRLYDPKYRCGMVKEHSHVTIITGGIGSGTVPMRFGADPDWWLVELKSTHPDRWRSSVG